MLQTREFCFFSWESYFIKAIENFGASVDDRKTRGKDQTRLPVPNLSLCHWSSQLFNLHSPSSTDVPVLLLNQPNDVGKKIDAFVIRMTPTIKDQNFALRNLSQIIYSGMGHKCTQAIA